MGCPGQGWRPHSWRDPCGCGTWGHGQCWPWEWWDPMVLEEFSKGACSIQFAIAASLWPKDPSWAGNHWVLEETRREIIPGNPVFSSQSQANKQKTVQVPCAVWSVSSDSDHRLKITQVLSRFTPLSQGSGASTPSLCPAGMRSSDTNIPFQITGAPKSHNKCINS